MPRTIYKVIRAIDLEDFEKAVEEALNEGYMLQGGVTKNVTLPSYKAKKSTTAIEN